MDAIFFKFIRIIYIIIDFRIYEFAMPIVKVGNTYVIAVTRR